MATDSEAALEAHDELETAFTEALDEEALLALLSTSPTRSRKS
jgi:hypothetical protein